MIVCAVRCETFCFMFSQISVVLICQLSVGFVLMAARLVFVVVPAATAWSPHRFPYNVNMRTSQPYGSWTEDFHALITVGNSFTIPKEDLFDHPESVDGGDLKKFCETGPSQGLYCVSSIEEVVLK